MKLTLFMTGMMWIALTSFWGWMIYIFFTGSTAVGFAGLLGMCLISLAISITCFIYSFRKDGDDYYYYDE